ncbi:hypothetical protein HYX58_06130 [Candidatus Dependentiae bacterium]|nr:hypothetical protein [Candidatus Dependentiae bacterium]
MEDYKLNRQKTSIPSPPTTPRSNPYAVITPYDTLSSKAQAEQKDIASISFYANVPTIDKGDVDPNNIGSNRSSIELNILKKEPIKEDAEKSEKKKKDDWFYRACARHMKLNANPTAPKSQMMKTLNLNKLEIDQRDGGIPGYLEASKRIHKALKHDTKISKGDLAFFVPEIFRIESNFLKTLPDEFSQLASVLRELSLAGNQFDEIPKVVNKLKKLVTLNVSENPIKEIQWENVKEIKTLKKLLYSGKTKCVGNLLQGIAEKID